MAWQLHDTVFRETIHRVVSELGGRVALAGTVGTQIYLAAAVGLDKLGPPARSIELVPLDDARAPERIGLIPVVTVDALGFEASVEASRRMVQVNEERFPVASPEHILGMQLSAPDLRPDAKWASFVLMRTFAARLDLEEARGFLKRCPLVERQSLLAELAYLAA